VAAAGGVVGIHAIGGMAGVGKTALAVHAAHKLAPRFPAGQIFLPLHGHTPAVQAAQHLGDRRGEANALNDLGVMRRPTGDYPAAAQAQEQALGLYRDLGDRLGQANALTSLGVVRRATWDYPGAGPALEQALGIYRDIGDRGGEVEALNEAGTLHRVSG